MTDAQDLERAIDDAAATAAARQARTRRPVPEDAVGGTDMFPARVTGSGADAQSFHVLRERDGAELHARTADSCMIQPRPDDLVLCAAYAAGSGTALYILSVLVRADVSQPAVLAVAGGLTVAVPDGPVTLQAGQSLNLLGGTAMTLTSETLSVHAEAGILHLDSAVLESDDAVASIGTLRLIGDRLLSLVKIVSGQHRRSTRKVEEVDQVQAGEVVVAGERLITNTAHQIVHVSTEDMRFDGARIHMG